ncbi:MAG: CDGSH iron-sulfur domain-containing protein [Betaproteobacteria bacterium]|nr:CDGSH iron-sulfur domain-containing protein [Betaproteobacteria bacterium]
MANKVTLGVDGPLHFSGTIDLLAADGQFIKQEQEVWMCRCGASKNKPYCDGSHRGSGFRDTALPARTEFGEAGTGGLCVTLRADGPLKCVGPLQIDDAAGATVWRGEDTALCRCGASTRKPFCDGSHRQTGFKA